VAGVLAACRLPIPQDHHCGVVVPLSLQGKSGNQKILREQGSVFVLPMRTLNFRYHE